MKNCDDPVKNWARRNAWMLIVMSVMFFVTYIVFTTMFYIYVWAD